MKDDDVIGGDRIFCPTCGDVTDGHPAMDKLYAEMLEGGFKIKMPAKEWIGLTGSEGTV